MIIPGKIAPETEDFGNAALFIAALAFQEFQVFGVIIELQDAAIGNQHLCFVYKYESAAYFLFFKLDLEQPAAIILADFSDDPL